MLIFKVKLTSIISFQQRLAIPQKLRRNLSVLYVLLPFPYVVLGSDTMFSAYDAGVMVANIILCGKV